jgi:hypothetical protein
MGLVSEITQSEDVVCVVFGGHLPFVVRPAGEHYRFTGQCYVHDIMNGEALEEMAAGNFTHEWFPLC